MTDSSVILIVDYPTIIAISKCGKGDNVLGSVCPAVRYCVCSSSPVTFKFGAKGGHYRSEGFVSLSVNQGGAR